MTGPGRQSRTVRVAGLGEVDPIALRHPGDSLILGCRRDGRTETSGAQSAEHEGDFTAMRSPGPHPFPHRRLKIGEPVAIGGRTLRRKGIRGEARRLRLALSLKLQMPMVRELLAREDIVVAPHIGKGPAIAVGEVTVELLDALCRLMRLLDRPRDIAFLQGLIERESVFRVLQGPEGARLRAIATLGDQSYRTARAIAWIKDNYAKPLRVEELAEIAGMGVSTLHHHFRALTAMSPLQYQKQIRLQEARARMSINGLDVGSAALEPLGAR